LISFSSWESQFREVVRALVKISRSFDLIKGSMNFGQRQQELSSKVVGTFVKSSKSNGIGKREGED